MSIHPSIDINHPMLNVSLHSALCEAYIATFQKHDYNTILQMANRDPSATAASFIRYRNRVLAICKYRFELILANHRSELSADYCLSVISHCGCMQNKNKILSIVN